MENPKKRILVTLTTDKIHEILHQVRRAIIKVSKENDINHQYLRVAIPKYFIDLVNYANSNEVSMNAFDSGNNKLTIFGIEVVYNYENFIVVFHEQCPVFLDIDYEVIDLK
jgi:hypothetical protein